MPKSHIKWQIESDIEVQNRYHVRSLGKMFECMPDEIAVKNCAFIDDSRFPLKNDYFPKLCLLPKGICGGSKAMFITKGYMRRFPLLIPSRIIQKLKHIRIETTIVTWGFPILGTDKWL